MPEFSSQNQHNSNGNQQPTSALNKKFALLNLNTYQPQQSNSLQSVQGHQSQLAAAGHQASMPQPQQQQSDESQIYQLMPHSQYNSYTIPRKGEYSQSNDLKSSVTMLPKIDSAARFDLLPQQLQSQKQSLDSLDALKNNSQLTSMVRSPSTTTNNALMSQSYRKKQKFFSYDINVHNQGLLSGMLANGSDTNARAVAPVSATNQSNNSRGLFMQHANTLGSQQGNVAPQVANTGQPITPSRRQRHEAYSSPLNPVKQLPGARAQEERSLASLNLLHTPQRTPELTQRATQMQLATTMNAENVAKSGNLTLKYSTRTKAGCTVQKQAKTNQDSAIVCPKNLQDLGYLFFAVADGHGLNGHLVSGFIKKNLPKNLVRFIKQEVTEAGIKQGISRAFYTTNHEIFSSDFDSNLSGSTLVGCLIENNKVHCANVGDSRAVMARLERGNLIAIPLSTDQKPSLERERQRVLKAGGRVDRQKDYQGTPVGPLRVWLQNLELPGLAMTRSFGDKIGMQCGVIADPEITEIQIEADDKFIVIASDGVFEYLSNLEIIKFVAPYYEKGQIDLAAERVVTESANAWRRESFARDDITVIVIFIS